MSALKSSYVAAIVILVSFNSAASWTWPLAFGHHEDRNPTHGYAATREAAMTAFAKSDASSGYCERKPASRFLI